MNPNNQSTRSINVDPNVYPRSYQHPTWQSHSPGSGSDPTYRREISEQNDYWYRASTEDRPSKRRAVGISPSGISDDVESGLEFMPHAREDIYTATDVASAGSVTDAHIRIIFKRLADVELKLENLTPSVSTRRYSQDIASMRSILSPAMQASSDDYSYPRNATSTIYNDRHVKEHGDETDLLSLRRNLSHPENPPFGVWWTYTIEETLAWPILGFHGMINDGLDALMDSSDEEENSSEEDDGTVAARSSIGKRKERRRVEQANKGLDDGILVSELIESFLRNVHTKNPILDASLLRVRAATMVEDGLNWDGETCQVLLACALGAISYPWNVAELQDFSSPKTSPERYAMGQEYFKAAQKRIGSLCEHSSLISAQCLFMTGVFLMYIQKPVAGWRAFNSASIACRSYISKRIARKNKGLPVPQTQSMERRLCWSCIKSEREIAVEFGMETSGLNLMAYTTTLPTPPNGYASDVNQTIPTTTTSLQDTPDSISPSIPYDDRSWYYYLTEIMLRKLEMRIDIFFQDKRKEAYRRASEPASSFFQTLVQALLEFDYQLRLYYKSLPPVMQFPLEDLTPCPDELRQYLRLRLFSVRHDITLPALYILLHNDISQWADQLVADLVLLANECLALDVKFLQIAITTHRHHATWLGPRKGVRSALILLAAERLAAQRVPRLEKLYVPSAEVWEDGVRSLIRGLRYWKRESRDCSAYLDIIAELFPALRGSVVDH